MATFELDIKGVASHFLESLKICSTKEVELLVGLADVKILEATLEIIDAILNNFPKNEVVPHNILYAIICILKWNRPSTEGNKSWILNVLNVISQSHPLSRNSLIQLGVVSILASTMKLEAENKMYDSAFNFWSAKENCVFSVHTIAVFIPSITNPSYNNITASSKDIMLKGPRLKSRNCDYVDLLKNVAEVIFPTLFNICQKQNCNTDYYILLLKFIFWSYKIKIAELVPFKEILRFAKNLINENPFRRDHIVIGLAIVNALRHRNYEWLVQENVGKCLKERHSSIIIWSKETRYEWINQMYAHLATSWISINTLYRAKFNDEYLASQIADINSMLDFIMPTAKYEIASDMNAGYKLLRHFLRIILNMPDSSLNPSPDGIKKFDDLVTKVIKTLDAILIHYNFFNIYSDLGDIEEYQHVPKTPMDIQLELCKSAAFDRVLGSSKSPRELRRNPLVRTLRLLSILYEVNENLGVLFCGLSRERLIDRNRFASEVLQDGMNNAGENVHYRWVVRKYIYDFTLKYPFLIPFKHRQSFYTDTLSFLKDSTPKYACYKLARKSTLNYIADNFTSMVQKSKYIWDFTFEGEKGYGDGPTKEFYSEFSRDCQRFDRGLWLGSPGEIIDNVSYVNSENGLFPNAKHPNDPRTNSSLIAIGVIMAKSVKDNCLLNISFSNAFYKCLFKKNLEAQQLSLIDIKDVMPSIFKFVESLVDALKQKGIIKNDNSLTTEEQNQAINNLTCDGCLFEDLCINFTLPGHPDIEMKEGGRDTLLNIDNVEEYLKLLVWWLLYKNPQESIKQIQIGFTQILNINLQYFNPDEYEAIFCGLTTEQWTVEYLKKNSLTANVISKKPVVQYLFEVLSSFSDSDKRNFLQFVTSSSRLPVGGLAALNPKLTICHSRFDGNPDDYLPLSSTCFNTISIAEYSSKERLKEKLLLAIREGRDYFNYC